MSHKLISHSPDLKKLRDEGFELEIVKAHLLVHHVPYVTSSKEVAFGVLVTPLGNISGDQVLRPHDHTCYFKGELPCDKDGNPLKGLVNSSQYTKLAENLEVDHYFSAKPQKGSYDDYYQKITTYINILSAHAELINDSVSARTFKVVESTDPDIAFHYLDTNSSRAEITFVSEKLNNLKIAIVGVGGTGSYILDFVSKTQVKEIHLFDEDLFMSHNAFRAPGAASIDVLLGQPKKVAYFHEIYSKMHKYIIPHEYFCTSTTLTELLEMNFVFICMDGGEEKQLIIQALTEAAIPFVDTGIGINVVDERLTGSVRVTSCTKDKNDHINQRISFSDVGEDDYNKNVQIAEINALNAVFAVIKWKKLFGFYHDLEQEHNMTYNIDCNQIINDDNNIS